MGAQALDVVHEVPGGVLLRRGVGRRAPATPLVEENDAVGSRVVIAAHDRIDAAARAAVQQHDGLSGRRAAFLEIELMQARDLEPSRAVGDDLGIKREAPLFGRWLFVHWAPALRERSLA